MQKTKARKNGLSEKDKYFWCVSTSQNCNNISIGIVIVVA